MNNKRGPRGAVVPYRHGDAIRRKSCRVIQIHTPSTQIGIDSGTRNIFAKTLHGLDSMYGRFFGLRRASDRGCSAQYPATTVDAPTNDRRDGGCGLTQVTPSRPQLSPSLPSARLDLTGPLMQALTPSLAADAKASFRRKQTAPFSAFVQKQLLPCSLPSSLAYKPCHEPPRVQYSRCCSAGAARARASPSDPAAGARGIPERPRHRATTDRMRPRDALVSVRLIDLISHHCTIVLDLSLKSENNTV